MLRVQTHLKGYRKGLYWGRTQRAGATRQSVRTTQFGDEPSVLLFGKIVPCERDYVILALSGPLIFLFSKRFHYYGSVHGQRVERWTLMLWSIRYPRNCRLIPYPSSIRSRSWRRTTTPSHRVHEGYGFRPPSGVSTPLTGHAPVDTLVPDVNGLGWPGMSTIGLISTQIT